jgi:hypothetical protein
MHSNTNGPAAGAQRLTRLHFDRPYVVPIRGRDFGGHRFAVCLFQ